MARVFHGPGANSMEALKESQSTDPNQWPDLIISSSTTGLKEWPVDPFRPPVLGGHYPSSR